MKNALQLHDLAGVATAAFHMNSGFVESALMRMQLAEAEQYIRRLEYDRETLDRQNRSLSTRLLDAKQKKNEFEAKVVGLQESEARMRAEIKAKVVELLGIQESEARMREAFKAEADALRRKLFEAKQAKKYWKQEASLTLKQRVVRKLLKRTAA
jgi:hypothetical protein